MKAVLLALLLMAVPVHAGECFDISPDDGDLSFEIDQAGTTFGSTFDRFQGSVCEEADTIMQVQGWVEPGSVQAGLPEIEDALRAEEFFDVARHGRATFESTSIEKTPDGYVAHGFLELKGISRPVDASFSVTNDAEGRQVKGSLVLKRLEFQIGTGEWADTRWIGETATVKFSGRLERKGDG